MKSRVHPKYKTRYRVTNWADYDRALVNRGDLTVWITPEAIDAWNAKASGLRGAPRKYSDLAIESALTIRLIFHLPLRQAEGFLRSLLDLMDLSLEAPDHTTLSRRGSTLKVNLGVLQSGKPMHLIIDSTGLSMVGEGEWAAAKHGGGGKRGWRKLHLGVEALVHKECARRHQERQSSRSSIGPVDSRSMNSRVHPKYKTRYRVTNWSSYDRALVQRGDITLWITPEAIKAWKPKASHRRGAPRKYSNLAIETVLTLRLVFQLPLRQAEGFLRSLLELMDLNLGAPDHTTLSRRSKDLRVTLGLTAPKKPIHLIIDSTGLSIVGEGEWAAAKHGERGKRGWRKLHLGVDQAGVIQAQILTDSASDDGRTGVKIIKKAKGKLRSVTGDAAYDTVAIYKLAELHGTKVVIPPARSASVSKRGTRSAERDRTIRRVHKLGRREWKKRSGYHRQGTVENAFFRYKTMLGGRLHARGLAAQKAEVAIACKVLNRMLELGRPRSMPVAR